MSRFPTYRVAVNILLGLVVSVPAYSIEPENPNVKLEVLVFDYAEVPRYILAEAQGFAGRVFLQAGIGIEWTEILRKGAQHEVNERKETPKLVMRILPNSMIGEWANGRYLLGFSLVPNNGGMGRIAGAYYERVQELSGWLRGDPALALGYVIAHELGHLLLGAHSHSDSGIMSFPFGSKELNLASQGRLRFTLSQSSRIRERFQKQLAGLHGC